MRSSSWVFLLEWCSSRSGAASRLRTLYRWLVPLLALLTMAAPVAANQACEAVFPTGLQSHTAGGQISFGLNAQLQGNPSNTLTVGKVSSSFLSWSKSCGSQNCSANGRQAAALALVVDSGTASTRLRVDQGQTGTLGGDYLNEYQEVLVDSQGRLDVSSAFSSYRIKSLRLNADAVLNLTAGDYWIESLALGNAVRINVVGGGTARLFVKSGITFPRKTLVNSASATQPGDAAQLFIYSGGDIRLESSSLVAALVYASNTLTFDNAKLHGAASVGRATLGAGSSLVYQANALGSGNFAGICGDAPLPLPDLDGDGIADDFDRDLDGDGISNQLESLAGTDPRDASSTPADLDANGVPDSLEAHDRSHQCVAAFPNGVQSNSPDGLVEFQYDAQLHDASQSLLYSLNVLTNAGSYLPSCGDSQCRAMGMPAPPLMVENFKTSPSSQVVWVTLGANATLGQNGVTDYRKITIGSLFTLTLSQSAQPYRIQELSVGFNSTLKLPAGDYWIERLNLESDAAIEVIGEGTVRLFVKDRLYVPWLATLNANTQDASRLVMYHFGTVELNSGSETHALLYAQGEVNLNYRAYLFGAVSARHVTLQRESHVRFRPEAVATADFGGICDIDQDGIYDGRDDDRDGDGFSNELELLAGSDPNNPLDRPSDLDGDGIPDALDDDRDGDGRPNAEDAFPDDPTEWSDLDGDGIGDNSDPDRDGDGISNVHEEQVGTDPNDAGSVPADFDGDGVPDAIDNDRDGDGRPNAQDAFPDNPGEWSDLDGDGIGDNSDPDRDGDGFDNALEQSRGTDPNNAADYPDTVAPQLNVNNPDGQTLDAGLVVVSGLVSDPKQPYSGVSSLKVRSDRFNELEFNLLIEGSSFQGEVPLALGDNRLLFTARDASGNVTEVARLIKRQVLASFANVQPADGSVINATSVTLQGEVHTSVPLSELQFYVNDGRVIPSATPIEGVYRFELPDMPLQLGNNRFVLRIDSVGGSSVQTLTLQHIPDDADSIPAPELAIVAPTPGSLLSDESFRIKGRVISHAGPVSVQVDGAPFATPAGSREDFYFNELVSFNGQEVVTVSIVATDTLAKQTTLTATYYRDGSAPQILLSGGLAPAPAINPVVESPVMIEGSVIDSNLAGLTLNGQPVKLQPGTVAGQYDFAVAVRVAVGAQSALQLMAHDLSGQRTTQEYILQSQATVGITPLLPGEGAEFLSRGEVIPVQVAVRTSGLSDGVSVSARVGAGEVVALGVAGTLASGEVTLPAAGGTHRIAFEARNSAGQIVASTSREVVVVEDAAVALQLVRHEPALGAQNVEPNRAIELYFNKAIDLSQLVVEVRETLHGNTYLNLDALGLDFLNAQGYQLQEVHRDMEAVPGGLSILPGNQTVAFYPARHLGFNAELYVSVRYQGEELGHFNFKVRKLPTFVIGGVVDQFGQPLKGVRVSLPELGRTGVTNGDGSFAFGFQEAPGNEIPGGRQRLVINPDFATPGYGTQVRTLNLQEGRKNEVGLARLQELHPEIPFQLIASGQAEVSLASDELQLDLSESRLLFANGRTAGNVHVQFLPYEQLNARISAGAMPHWAFAVQPRGIRVEGPVGLKVRMPALGGGYDYLPEGTEHLVLVAFDPEREVIRPVGVGRIENHQVSSVGKLNIEALDYLGYALVDPKHNELLRDVAAGDKTLQDLLAALQ